ncbi:hypothetical protein G7Y89_g15614 [Cudoniella acicularis]|uniref:Uncharacterized protein n=1 Tax=Cudoniella acicularis TaxID=354080 RepID=A0A8H4VJT9_9HELO|nr:hypothetical protein G7Y89_g15614 [Cudoniella acicularis]
MLVECHGFTISKQDIIKKIESLLNTLVKKKVLFKGKWRKAEPASFKTLLYLVDTHMRVGLTEGVHSWDAYLSRQLSIEKSTLYKDIECLCFKDLSVQFLGSDDTKGIIMNVCLRFVKGYKVGAVAAKFWPEPKAHAIQRTDKAIQ